MAMVIRVIILSCLCLSFNFGLSLAFGQDNPAEDIITLPEDEDGDGQKDIVDGFWLNESDLLSDPDKFYDENNGQMYFMQFFSVDGLNLEDGFSYHALLPQFVKFSIIDAAHLAIYAHDLRGCSTEQCSTGGPFPLRLSDLSYVRDPKNPKLLRITGFSSSDLYNLMFGISYPIDYQENKLRLAKTSDQITAQTNFFTHEIILTGKATEIVDKPLIKLDRTDDNDQPATEFFKVVFRPHQPNDDRQNQIPFKSVDFLDNKYPNFMQSAYIFYRDKKHLVSKVRHLDTNKQYIFYFAPGFPERFKIVASYAFDYWNKALGKEVLILKGELAARPKSKLDESFASSASTWDIFASRHNIIQFIDDENVGREHRGQCVEVVNPLTGNVEKIIINLYNLSLHPGQLLEPLFFTQSHLAKLPFIPFGPQAIEELDHMPLPPRAKPADDFSLFRDQVFAACIDPNFMQQNRDQFASMLGQEISRLREAFKDRGINFAYDFLVAMMELDYFLESLTHELGHALGLTHNFAGSLHTNLNSQNIFQVMNIYSRIILRMMPEIRDLVPLTEEEEQLFNNIIPSSSVMDYHDSITQFLIGHKIYNHQVLPYDQQVVNLNYSSNFSDDQQLSKLSHPFLTDDENHDFLDAQQFDGFSDPLEHALWRVGIDWINLLSVYAQSDLKSPDVNLAFVDDAIADMGDLLDYFSCARGFNFQPKPEDNNSWNLYKTNQLKKYNLVLSDLFLKPFYSMTSSNEIPVIAYLRRVAQQLGFDVEQEGFFVHDFKLTTPFDLNKTVQWTALPSGPISHEERQGSLTDPTPPQNQKLKSSEQEFENILNNTSSPLHLFYLQWFDELLHSNIYMGLDTPPEVKQAWNKDLINLVRFILFTPSNHKLPFEATGTRPQYSYFPYVPLFYLDTNPENGNYLREQTIKLFIHEWSIFGDKRDLIFAAEDIAKELQIGVDYLNSIPEVAQDAKWRKFLESEKALAKSFQNFAKFKSMFKKPSDQSITEKH